MPEYLAPGVFVEETSRGSRPIEGVGTSTALFIGEHDQGPVGEMVHVSGLADYEPVFGEVDTADDSLGIAVHAFFANGGRRAVVLRMATGATAADYEALYRDVPDGFRDVDIILHHDQAWGDGVTGNPILAATIHYCESAGHCMVMIDTSRDTVLATSADVTALALPQSSYACLYYPWLELQSPAGIAASGVAAVEVPASACAAGIWGRIDIKRGVWKAPAGLDAGVNGIVGPLHTVDNAAQRQLNPHGINCIRNFPGRGTFVWGARTLAGRSELEWRYIPTRRTSIYVRESIYRGIQWAVFEPNDHKLWASLRTTVENFLYGLFSDGALQGDTPDHAYYVRCGLRQTMTQADINAGRVIIEVGLALLKPAEFVVIRIDQKTADAP